MENINIILNSDNMAEEIRNLKLDIYGDTMSTYTIVETKGYVVLEFQDYSQDNEDMIQNGKHILYGRKIENKFYFARMQQIYPLFDGDIDFYGEFFSSNSAELSFN